MRCAEANSIACDFGRLHSEQFRIPCECMAQPVKGTPPEVACALRKHAGSFSAPRKLTFTRRISALGCRSSSVPSKHSCPLHTYTTPLTHGENQAFKHAHADAGFKVSSPKAVQKKPLSSHHSPQNLIQILNPYASCNDLYLKRKEKLNIYIYIYLLQ